jgi:hypothetical protein
MLRTIPLFTNADTWHGGHYQLAIELNNHPELRLAQALTALWQFPLLKGCYLDRTVEPFDQPRVAPSLDYSALYGLAGFEARTPVACGSWISVDEDSSDWLIFYFPLGALATVFPVEGFPFDEHSHDRWTRRVDQWLANLGAEVYDVVPFKLALIGFEVADETYAAQLADTGIPTRRTLTYLWPEQGELRYYARNI